MAKKSSDHSKAASKKQSPGSRTTAAAKKSATRPVKASKAAAKLGRPAADDRIRAAAASKQSARVNTGKATVGSRGSTGKKTKVAPPAKPPAKPKQTSSGHPTGAAAISSSTAVTSHPSKSKGRTGGHQPDTAAARKKAVKGLVPKDPWYGIVFRAKDKERLQDIFLGGVLLPILVEIATRGGLLGFFTPLQRKLERAHDQFRRSLPKPGKRALTTAQHLAVLQDRLYVQELLALTLTCVKDNPGVWKSKAALKSFSDTAVDCYDQRHQRAGTAERLSALAEKITLEQATFGMGTRARRRGAV